MLCKKNEPYCNNNHNSKNLFIITQSCLKRWNRERLFTSLLSYSVWLIPALFYVVLLRLVRPWVIIRIGKPIHERMGHFAANTELYLCSRDMGIDIPNRPFIDILYYNGYVCNTQLQKMWNRVLKIGPTHLLTLMRIINSRLPDGGMHTVQLQGHPRDIHNLYECVPPHLSFTSEEEEFGKTLLESMRVASESLFICFIGRDGKYLQLIYPDDDYRHHDYRNTDVKNYLLAAEELANRGYYAIRMGATVAETLVSNNSRIIDYATNGQRSDFMDIYLGAKCRFFISVGTGIDCIPQIFRRPILYVNQVPLEYLPSWDKSTLFIPKKYWLDKEQRFMTIRAIFESGAGRFLYTQQYLDMGITLIENTPEEILKVTIEMDERLKGTWVTTEEDEDLQRRFWSLYKPSELHGKIYARIGADFLRENKDLLL